MKRLTLQEYMLQNMPPQEEEPKSLSPIHFRSVAKNGEELDAYNAAYHQFLKYFQRSPEQENAFGKMLADALFNHDASKLMVWYHGHRMLMSHKRSRMQKLS